MTRYARAIPSGRFVHFIARFVDNAYRLRDAEERSEYLRRLARTFETTSWRPLAYALMSTHIHLALISGAHSFSSWSRPMHASFSGWLNRRQRKRGPLFAERPTTILLPLEHFCRLVAYIHNNPVRAGLVARAEESDWTSHRAYVGLDPEPEGMDVNLGLHLCGFPTGEEGKRAFATFVDDQSGEARDPLLSGGGLKDLRRAIRFHLGCDVELSYPHADPFRRQLAFHAVGTDGLVVTPRWEGKIATIVELVSRETGVPFHRITSICRDREICMARRLVVTIAHQYCGFTLKAAGGAVGITGRSAGQLWANATEELIVRARELAEVLRRAV